MSHRDLLECPPVAALTTVMADGYPQTSVARPAGHAPLLLCYDPRQPLRFLEIRGTVVEMTGQGALDAIHRQVDAG